METLIIVVHVLASIAIIALILLQQGKGADAGASFGAGASQTVFGAVGSGNALTRGTAIFAVVFFATSFGLAVLAKQKAEQISDVGIPSVVSEAPLSAPVALDDEIPSLDTSAEGEMPSTDSSDDIPSSPPSEDGSQN